LRDALPDLPGADSSAGMFGPLPPLPAQGAVKSSVLWIAAGFGTMQLMRFGSNVALTYLFLPQAFGLFALTYVFLVGLHLFSDLGIRVSIIHNPRGDDPSFLDTAWTVQIVRGFLIWLSAAALAWPVAYGRPEPLPQLTWLLPLVGLTAIIDGFTSTKMHSLYRHMRQRQAVTIEVLSTTSSIAVTLTWAYFDANLLAMAAGPLVNSFLQLVLSHLLPGRSNRLRWHPASARELIHFGRWIFLSTMFTFLADHSDRIVVSYFSIAVLGVYHLANQIAAVPSTLMGMVARQTVLPLYSRLLEAGRDVHDSLRMIQVRVGAATALLIGGLIAVGPDLIRFLYPANFAEATWIVRLLAIVVMVNIFDNMASSLLIARGKPRLYALSNAVKVACLALFMPIAAWLDGLQGVIFSMILGEAGRYACTAIALHRDNLSIFRRDLGWAALALALGLGVGHLIDGVGPTLPEHGRNRPVLAGRIALGAVTVIACWGAVVIVGWGAGWFASRNGQRDSASLV
jgi:O-antigen/teichoic acid export membrane protein